MKLEIESVEQKKKSVEQSIAELEEIVKTS